MLLAAFVLLSLIVGAVLGRYLVVYSLIPAILLLLVPLTLYVASADGWMVAILLFILCTVAMNGAYFLSMLLHGLFAQTPRAEDLAVHDPADDIAAYSGLLAATRVLLRH